MPHEAQSLVNWSVFSRARSDLGTGFVRILGYFREDGETAIGRIEEAMQRRDTAALVLPAHRMKSEARQFGADLLGELAEEVEFAARRSIEQRTFPAELIPTVARLRPVYATTIEMFDKETNPLQSRRASFGRRAVGE